MAELIEGEREFLDPAEDHSAVLFKEICEMMNDRLLFSCLRAIVPIAQKRGLECFGSPSSQFSDWHRAKATR